MCFDLIFSEEQVEELTELEIPMRHSNKEKRFILELLNTCNIGDFTDVNQLYYLQKIDEDRIRVISVLGHYIAEHLVNILLTAGKDLEITVETMPYMVKVPFEYNRDSVKGLYEWLKKEVEPSTPVSETEPSSVMYG